MVLLTSCIRTSFLHASWYSPLSFLLLRINRNNNYDTNEQAPLKSHFDISDAQTVLALKEISNCLLTILEKRVCYIS